MKRAQSLFRLFTDGASRGNPGPSGAGAALYTPTNHPYARLCSYLGHCTNNAAEYHAVIHGLLLARSLNISRVLVNSDSQLLIYQINGRYAVTNPVLANLHKRLSIIVEHFDSCQFEFVRREDNAIADRLANVAIDDGVPLQLFLENGGFVDRIRKKFEHLQSVDIQQVGVS